MIGMNAEYHTMLLVFKQVAFETVLNTCSHYSSMNRKNLRMMLNVFTFSGLVKITFPSKRITGTTNLDLHRANLAFTKRSRSFLASLAF